MQRPGGPAPAPATPPPALAYWLSDDARIVVRAAARQVVDTTGVTSALRAAVTELDAAAIRSRWFDHAAAESFRRIAGHDPHAVALRLTNDERAALVACDPGLVAPLLDDDTRPARPVAVERTTRQPIDLPSPTGPVVVLDHDGISLTWAVAEFDGATVRVGRPSPGARIWARACEQTKVEPVDVEVVDASRRLTARAHPALSTLALARPDFRPGSGESVLLRLPDVVVVTPTAVAARVVTYAAPTPVLSIAAEGLPAEPTPASTVS